ncbi:MAG: alpha/beta hydrolase, partial [Nitrospinota bacterium]|nr:alpha/beta hydrolase [Nitrospinota bacterium]
PSIQINGRLLHAQAFGHPDNQVVIVIHGGPGWDYKSLLPLKALADEYYVVFYDQRGTGLSERVPQSELTLRSSLDDLDAVVDHYRGEGLVNIIGHSWGAMLATGYLGEHPEKVRRVALAEPGFFTGQQAKEAGIRMGPLWTWDFMSNAAVAIIQALHVKEPDADAAQDFAMARIAVKSNPEYYCNGQPPKETAQVFRPGLAAMQGILGSAMDEDGNLQMDLTQGLENFTSPVLFLASECNTKVGVKRQRFYMGFFPDARLEVIEGSGHMMFIEKPAESVAAVREYFKS